MAHPRIHRHCARILSICFALLFVMATISPTSASSYQARQSARALASRTWYVRVGYDSPHHAYQDMAFLPDAIWINVGDTVVFWSDTAEPHTVTFLKSGQKFPAFNPADAQQTHRQGTSSYNGHSYYNSGILSTMTTRSGFSPAYRTYRLTFDASGSFTYYCLLHGMVGKIHVRSRGTVYPHSQAYYSNLAAREGNAALDRARALTASALKQTSNHYVIVGESQGTAMVMRFLPRSIAVHVGDTVTFVARGSGMSDPHTVSYGADPPNFGFTPIGNPRNFTGQQLNSGLLEAGTSSATYRVTFKRAGTYQFFCALHDYMGMYLTVVVGGQSGDRDHDGDRD